MTHIKTPPIVESELPLKKPRVNLSFLLRLYTELNSISKNPCRLGELVKNGELMMIYNPFYSMNKFVTNKSKLPQDGAQVFPYMGWSANHPIYGVIGYHVTLRECHMIANHPI